MFIFAHKEETNIVKSKPVLKALLSLPALVLLGWFLYEQALVWTAPAPTWVISKKNLETSINCHQLEHVTGEEFNVVLADESSDDIISEKQAIQIIDRVIAKTTGIHTWLMWANSPTLVWITLSDGQRRLAWSDFDEIKPAPANHPSYPIGGRVAGIYIDARTGEPLLLVTDIIVGDVANGCFGILAGTPFAYLSRGQIFSMILLLPYLFILAIRFVHVKFNQ